MRNDADSSERTASSLSVATETSAAAVGAIGAVASEAAQQAGFDASGNPNSAGNSGFGAGGDPNAGQGGTGNPNPGGNNPGNGNGNGSGNPNAGGSGNGGNFVKASTEHYSVMQDILADQAYPSDESGFYQLDDDLRIVDYKIDANFQPILDPSGRLQQDVLHDFYVKESVTALEQRQCRYAHVHRL